MDEMEGGDRGMKEGRSQFKGKMLSLSTGVKLQTHRCSLVSGFVPAYVSHLPQLAYHFQADKF